MDKHKLIDYLNAQNLSDEEIVKILNDQDKCREMLEAISEYERTQRRQGIDGNEALKYYENYIKMCIYHKNRETILREIHGKI